MKTEQDNPPYDLGDSTTTPGHYLGDATAPQICEVVRLNNNQGVSKTFRVLAPLGLVKFMVTAGASNQQMQFTIKCLDKYEM